MTTFGPILALFYSISIFASICIYSFPNIRHLDSLLEKNDMNTFKMRLILRILVFFIISLIALKFNKLIALLNLMGCVLSVTLGFYFPYKLHLQTFAEQEKSSIEKGVNLVVLMLGVLGGALGLIYSLEDVLKN
jgi:ABC-type uncharacterized transport system permease subunit